MFVDELKITAFGQQSFLPGIEQDRITGELRCPVKDKTQQNLFTHPLCRANIQKDDAPLAESQPYRG